MEKLKDKNKKKKSKPRKIHITVIENGCPQCGGDYEISEVHVRCLECDYEIVSG